MTSFLTRRRLYVAGLVAAVVGAIAILGAVSKSSPSTAATQTTSAVGAQVPFAAWYWTMIVSQSNPNDLVLATNMGLFRSADGGKTWTPAGLTTENVSSLAESGSTIYAGGVRGPNPVIHNTAGRTVPNGTGVLSVSTDGGKTWKALHPSGLPKNAIQSMAVNPADDSELYVLLNTGGLYSSTDGAKSFKLVTSKLSISPWAIAVTQGGQFVSGDMDGGPHTSANAKAWKPTVYADANGGRMVMEYAVQPADSSHVLMTSIGIEQSTDAGKTWQPALKSTVMFGPVAYAPKQPQVAYAIGFDRSIWRSDDGGKTWTQVK